jgi:hypothetical protein
VDWLSSFCAVTCSSMSSIFGSGTKPSLSCLASVTMRSTLPACAPPITAVRLLGQAKMKRGSRPRPHIA